MVRSISFPRFEDGFHEYLAGTIFVARDDDRNSPFRGIIDPSQVLPSLIAIRSANAINTSHDTAPRVTNVCVGAEFRAKERRAERWRWPTRSTRRGRSRPPSSCPDRERRSSCRGGGHASEARFAFAAVDVVVVAVADGGEVDGGSQLEGL